MIKLTNLTKSHGSMKILDQLDLHFLSGINLIKGGNGTGKSTLLKLLVNLDEQYSGSINYEEKDFLSHLSYVPDEPNFFNHIRVSDFVKAISTLKKTPTKTVEANNNFWDIHEIAEREIGMLSLGQMKRLFLSVSYNPDIKYFIFDEPFNGLDSKYSEKLKEYLHSLQEKCVVLVCHNEELLKGLNCNVYRLQNKNLVKAESA